MAPRLATKDLLELRFVSDPQLSPGGSHAAAVITEILPGEAGKPPAYRSNVFLFDPAGKDVRRFTRSPLADTSPRFSPQGDRLAFLSRRTTEDQPQLHLIPLSGGESEALPRLGSGVRAFAWHPKGRSILLVSRGEEAEHRPGTPRSIERMVYKREGKGFLPSAPEQLFLLDLGRKRLRQLTRLRFDPGHIAFAPDGRTIFFTAPGSERDEEQDQVNLWALPLAGGRPRALLPEARPIVRFAVSPDGHQLALLAPREPHNEASPSGIWRVPAGGGEPLLLSGDLDCTQSVAGDSRFGSYDDGPRFAAGGRILINANREGRSELATLGPDGRVERLHQGAFAVTAFASEGDLLLFVREAPDSPGELYLRTPDGTERQLSDVNRAFKRRKALHRPEGPFQVDGGGTNVPYWLLRPERPRGDRALVLQVHGGPHTNYGYGFFFEFQLLAAKGYTVVYGNPRGGSSYGQDYATGILGRYGTVDADDVLAIARDALERCGEPPPPIHLTGGSYGGFMTNWLVGRTDLFRSAVTQRSISNFVSFYGTSDIGPRFAELEQGGNPWEDMERLWEQSPLRHVANVRTPLLILHAEQDHRCPIEQAEQLFTALKRLGQAPTRLIRFPDEGHDLSRSGRPDRRIARLEAILAWFREHA